MHSICKSKQRLSFITEEVANHTNQTIGALLNATFGNAPELLISTAALSEGYYRVVQLTLLGSMLTNLLFVFGLSCLIGGIRYQTQSLRIVSGNASIGMLMLAVAGLALPASLILSDEMVMGDTQRQYVDKNGDGISDIVDGPTESMLGFSRFNAVIMVVGYGLYLLFQLGTHGEEFEDEPHDPHENNDEYGVVDVTKQRSRRNKFCGRLFGIVDEVDEHAPSTELYQQVEQCADNAIESIEIEMPQHSNGMHHSQSAVGSHRKYKSESDVENSTFFDDTTVHSSNASRKRSSLQVKLNAKSMQRSRPQDAPSINNSSGSNKDSTWTLSSKSHCSDGSVEEGEPASIMIPVSEVHEQLEEGKSLLYSHIRCFNFYALNQYIHATQFI